MKNTMKKLLCMALAIMLLVSAVPVFAAADGGITIMYYVNGEKVGTDTWDVETKLQGEVLAHGVEIGTLPSDSEFSAASEVGSGDHLSADYVYVAGKTYYFKVTSESASNEGGAGESGAGEGSGSSQTTEVAPIKVVVKVNTSDNVVYSGEKVPANGESAKVENLLSYCWNKSWDSAYTFDHAWSSLQQKNVKLTDSVVAGDTLTFLLNTKTTEDDDDYDGSLTDKVSSLKPVILHVYLNNNFNAEDAHYTITSIAEDGTLNLNKDVKEFLQKYYTAKTSDGIGYDGMYVADGYFGVKYLSDEKYEIIGGDRDEYDNTTLDYMRSAGYVHLNVMLTNAKAKTTSTTTASDNPKTGDTIFAPIMVMGLTGTALAAAYVIGKKRFAR